MGQFAFGQPVTRTEDPKLLTGRGNYVSDVNLHRQARLSSVRTNGATRYGFRLIHGHKVFQLLKLHFVPLWLIKT